MKKETRPGKPASAASAGEKIILTLLSFGNDHPIEAKISRGLNQAVRWHGYQAIAGYVPIDPRAEVRRLVAQYGERIAGIAIQPFRPNRELAELLLTPPVKGIPHIIIGHYFYHLQINACVIDNFGGMYAVTDLLIRSGRRRLAYLGEVSLSSTEHERFQGFVQACLHHGLRVPPEFIVNKYFDSDLRLIIQNLFDGPEPPDGVVCLFDGLAQRVMGILGELGIEVPGQASVVSFGDDEDVATLCDPPLSTVRHPAVEMGAVAGQLLAQQIEGVLPDKPGLFMLPVGMRLRESCGTPAALRPGGACDWEIPFSGYSGVAVEPGQFLDPGLKAELDED